MTKIVTYADLQNKLDKMALLALRRREALVKQQKGITRLRRRIGQLEADYLELEGFAAAMPKATFAEVVECAKEARKRARKASRSVGCDCVSEKVGVAV